MADGEAYEAKLAEINRAIYEAKDGDRQPELKRLLNNFAQAYEELATYLGERYGTSLPEGEGEWRDAEVDDAINAYRFWWTWGN